MANILYPPARPQSVGEILDSAFRLFRATVVSCLPYAALALIAGQLPNLYSLASGQPPLTPAQQLSHPGVFALLYVVGTLLTLVFYSAILLRQYAIATGGAPATGAELSTAVRRIPAMLLLVILSVLALAACFVPAFLFQGSTRLAALALGLVPASCLVLALSSAFTLLVLAREGAAQSMVHSARLTWGNWWRLTLIYTVAIVLVLVLYIVFGTITGVLSVLLGHPDVAVITAATTVVVLILGSIITPFYTALSLAILGDLLVRKEGTDLAQRISAPASR